MKNKQLLLFLVACISFMACNNDKETLPVELSPEEIAMNDFYDMVNRQPATADDMTALLNDAHAGVLDAIDYLRSKNGRIVINAPDLLDPGSVYRNFLMDSDCKARVFVRGEEVLDIPAKTYDFTWRIDENGPTAIIFTDTEGREHRTMLVTRCGNEYYFEGNFPTVNGAPKEGSKDEYDRFVTRVVVDADPQYREQVEEWYDAAKAENEKQ